MGWGCKPPEWNLGVKAVNRVEGLLEWLGVGESLLLPGSSFLITSLSLSS